MTGEYWKRIQTLFEEVIDLPPDEQARFIEAICVEEPTVCAELKRLIAAHEDPHSLCQENWEERVGLLGAVLDRAPDSGDLTGRRVGPVAVSG